MLKVNLIMVEPRALMFLSSISRHNAEHLLLFFSFYLRFSICVRLHFKVKITIYILFTLLLTEFDCKN